MCLQVNVEGCAFSGNSADRPLLVADKRDTPGASIAFFGDDSAPQVCTWTGELSSRNPNPGCELSEAQAQESDKLVKFLTDSDPWLLAAKQAWHSLCRTTVTKLCRLLDTMCASKHNKLRVQGLYFVESPPVVRTLWQERKEQIIAGAVCLALILLIFAAVECVWQRNKGKSQAGDMLKAGEARSSEAGGLQKGHKKSKDRWDAIAQMNIP